MYSVNVDKLVKTSETQAESLLEITDNIIEELGNHKAFAVLGGKVDTFKIAYNIMEKGNKVLFVDGDIRTDVFLGKYKLGKSAKGVLDYIKRPEKNEEIVCVTNHKNLSLIFTGINEDGVVTDDEIMIFKSLIDKYSKEYDYIVVDSDEDGTLAAFCGYAAIIADKETYDEDELNNRVIQLEDKECNVLGVIIRE